MRVRSLNSQGTSLEACAMDDESSLLSTVRRCGVLRTILPKERLLRFVATPEGAVICDLRCRLPGRGVWVTAQKSIVDEAVRRGIFSQGLRRPVQVSATLGTDVEVLLEQRALQALALANKAGACRIGHQRVEEVIKSQKAVGLFAAFEASPRQWDSLKACVSFMSKKNQRIEVQIFQGFSTEQLSQIFGKSGVFYGALIDHAGSNGYLVCVDRLMWYRTSSHS